MKFLLDENFPRAAQSLLRSHGHAVIDMRGTQDEGATDTDIFSLAQKYEAVFLTTDRDFFHTIPHLFPSHSGIVVIALRQPNRAAILERLSWFLSQLQDCSLVNRVYLLRDKTCVKYPPQEET